MGVDYRRLYDPLLSRWDSASSGELRWLGAGIAGALAGCVVPGLGTPATYPGLPIWCVHVATIYLQRGALCDPLGPLVLSPPARRSNPFELTALEMNMMLLAGCLDKHLWPDAAMWVHVALEEAPLVRVPGILQTREAHRPGDS